MTIICEDKETRASFHIADANAEECMKAVAAAMITEGYQPEHIADAMRDMAWRLDKKEDES
jgi:hypothetical protein